LLVPGNPSSVHAEGRAARTIVERARESVAALVGALPRQVVFTSGATESAALALTPGALGRERRASPLRLLVGATEHPCVLHGHGFGDRCRQLPVDRAGRIDLSALAAALADGEGPALVAVQHANSETGVVQPLAEIRELVAASGSLLAVDAVQSAGKLPLDMESLGADALLLSAHKLGGPKGTGALVLGGRAQLGGGNLARGGGQERGRRAGTENVSGIAGFGTAARIVMTKTGEAAALEGLRDRIGSRLREMVPGIVVFGEGVPRLPNTLMFAIPGVGAETLLMALDLAGVAVSSGSACSSGKVGRSHVLAAMGVPADVASGAIRVSLDWRTTGAMTEDFLSRFSHCLAALCKNSMGVVAAAA
jgi:cysteine desulfurase